jgi:DNA-binding CsgD family transcriptional regulator
MLANSLDDLSRLLEQLHSTIAGNDTWQGVLGLLGRYCCASDVVISVADFSTQQIGALWHQTGRGGFEAVGELEHDNQAFLTLMTKQPLGHVCELPTGVRPQGSALHRSSPWLSMKLLSRDNARIFLSLREKRDVKTGAKAQFVSLSPHLVQAAGLEWERRYRAVSSRVMALIRREPGFGHIVCSKAMRILYADDLGQESLRTLANTATQPYVLAPQDHEAQRDLRHLVCDHVAEGDESRGQIALARNDGEAPLRVEVRSFLPSDTGLFGLPSLFAPAAILSVSRPDHLAGLRQDMLKSKYGLTRAEAKFSVELLDGGGREGVAKRLGISSATARTHLSRIFAKTGTTRQAELVALILQAAL